VTKLSTNTRAGRGGAPGAGFENAGTSARLGNSVDFLTSIAAARQALRGTCREYDCAGRMGGDEFVVILAWHHAKSGRRQVMQYREVARLAGVTYCYEDILSVSVVEACCSGRRLGMPNSFSP